MVHWQEEVKKEMLTQLATYPGVMTYRHHENGHVNHVAVRWQAKSLCGLTVPQMVWRPLDSVTICGRCQNSLRVMGLKAR